VLPDFVRETFAAGTDHGGVDTQRRAMRYLEWVHDAVDHPSEWLEVLHGVGFAAECQALSGEDRRCFVARRRD
jgi:hypothetical protein